MPKGSSRLFPVLLTMAAAATLVALAAYKLKNAIYYDPNWIRLQPSFAFFHGQGPYTPAGEGVVLPSLYGPVFVILNALTAFFQTPEAVVRVGTVLAMAAYFAPALYLTLRAALPAPGAGNRGFGWIAAAAFCAFGLITYLSSALRPAAFHIHPDALALGLGGGACALLLETKRPSTARLIIAAGLAVLAVGAKQVALPLPFILAGYLLLVERLPLADRVPSMASGSRLADHVPSKAQGTWSATLVFVVAGVGMAAGLTAWAVHTFGWDNLIFHLVTVPLGHPWREEGAWPAITKLIREGLIIAPFLWVAFRWTARTQARAWMPFLIVGLLMIPACVAGKTKIGGSNNALSYTLYFLLLGGLEAFLRSGKPEARRWGAAALIALLGIHVPGAVYRHLAPPPAFDYARTAYAFTRAHPGEVYFPRLGLLSFMAEGRFYHDSTGLRDRIWAGRPISREHFLRHIPPRLRLVAFRQGNDDETDVLYLEDYAGNRSTNNPELPGFIVYTRQE